MSAPCAVDIAARSHQRKCRSRMRGSYPLGAGSPGGRGWSPGCGFREALRPPGQVSSTTSARVVGPLRASCGDLPAHPHAGFAAEAADVLAEGDVELGKGGVTDTH